MLHLRRALHLQIGHEPLDPDEQDGHGVPVDGSEDVPQRDIEEQVVHQLQFGRRVPVPMLITY